MLSLTQAAARQLGQRLLHGSGFTALCISQELSRSGRRIRLHSVPAAGLEEGLEVLTHVAGTPIVAREHDVVHLRGLVVDYCDTAGQFRVVPDARMRQGACRRTRDKP
jgi:hypothetical protein